jgi:hypothetical protein
MAVQRSAGKGRRRSLGSDPLPALDDDGLETPEVGSWGEDKYRLVRNYAQLFAQSMRGKWECLVYVDLRAFPIRSDPCATVFEDAAIRAEKGWKLSGDPLSGMALVDPGARVQNVSGMLSLTSSRVPDAPEFAERLASFPPRRWSFSTTRLGSADTSSACRSGRCSDDSHLRRVAGERGDADGEPGRAVGGLHPGLRREVRPAVKGSAALTRCGRECEPLT